MNNQNESDLRQAPFTDLRAAIRFYLSNNPARQKFVNILEPDRIAAKNADEKAAAADIWAAIVRSLRNVEIACGGLPYYVFTACEIGFPEEGRQHPADVAKQVHLSERKIRRMINTCRAELEDELIARGLIPPADNRFD